MMIPKESSAPIALSPLEHNSNTLTMMVTHSTRQFNFSTGDMQSSRRLRDAIENSHISSFLAAGFISICSGLTHSSSSVL